MLRVAGGKGKRERKGETPIADSWMITLVSGDVIIWDLHSTVPSSSNAFNFS